MSLILTYWEDPRNGKNTEDDFDGILEIRIKSVKQIPDLIANMPENCTMISLEYSGNHKRNGKLTSPNNPRRFREIWRKGQPIPQVEFRICPFCHSKLG